MIFLSPIEGERGEIFGLDSVGVSASIILAVRDISRTTLEDFDRVRMDVMFRYNEEFIVFRWLGDL